jgi:uncharacterized UPF0160 family protein
LKKGGFCGMICTVKREIAINKELRSKIEWAGGNEKTLPEISGIQDATFCHNGCFFVRSKTKESILEMCRVAMN